MDISSLGMPDIASLSMVQSSVKLGSDVGVAMLSKSLDNLEVAGESLTKAMELSVNPSIGGNFDMSV